MTAEELRSEIWRTKPQPPAVWLLRVMIFQPDRIATKAEIAEWSRLHPAPERRWFTGKDGYGKWTAVDDSRARWIAVDAAKASQAVAGARQ